MWPFLVVLLEPHFGLFTHLVQSLKHEHVEHRLAVAAIESFNETILHRLARFGEIARYAMILGPFSQRHGDKLPSVVCSELEGIAADSRYPFKLAHCTLWRHAEG